ncbi:MAG TPA: NUDIX domain-containing protein [Gammaproteobacteria bacterium]|nr:NUDIX domain-containing protein [Gammaproteobacteria bacterium]
MKSRRLSAGVVVVRETAAGLRWLLLRAYRNWDFPKGIVEAGEEPLAAAIRETAEETGIEDLDLAWGRDYVDTLPYAANKVARYFLARTATERVELAPNPELGRPEHHEFRWVDLDQARALVPPRLRRVLEWAAARMRVKP